MALLSVSEAATQSGLSRERIRKLLSEGRIMGTKLDRVTWVVNSQSLEDYMATPRRPGRPRKDAP